MCNKLRELHECALCEEANKNLNNILNRAYPLHQLGH